MPIRKIKEKGKTTVVTSTGVRLEIKAVSSAKIRARAASVKDPLVPQRKARNTADDAVMMIPLTADVLVNREDYEPEDHVAWLEYQQGLEEANKKRGDKILRAVLSGVINQDAITPPDGWAAAERKEGSDIEEDEWEEQKAFIEFEVTGGVFELQEILYAIQSLGGDIPEEAIDEMMDSFRSDMARVVSDKASTAFRDGLEAQ